MVLFGESGGRDSVVGVDVVRGKGGGEAQVWERHYILISASTWGMYCPLAEVHSLQRKIGGHGIAVFVLLLLWKMDCRQPYICMC